MCGTRPQDYGQLNRELETPNTQRRTPNTEDKGRAERGNDDARTVRAGLALNDEGITQARMTNSCSAHARNRQQSSEGGQRFEVRSRARAPFRIAQLDLARVWRPGGKKYQTRVRNLQKPANF
jgi:hypothetical protein